MKLVVLMQVLLLALSRQYGVDPAFVIASGLQGLATLTIDDVVNVRAKIIGGVLTKRPAYALIRRFDCLSLMNLMSPKASPSLFMYYGQSACLLC